MPGKQRAILLLLAVAAAVAATVVLPSLGGSDNDAGDEPGAQAQPQPATSGATAATAERRKPERARPAAQTISVRGGKPVGGVKRLSYRKGQVVNLVVKSDGGDELHVHGYDIERQVPAGGRARLRFPAKLEGIFDVELHGSDQQIAELRVEP